MEGPGFFFNRKLSFKMADWNCWNLPCQNWRLDWEMTVLAFSEIRSLCLVGKWWWSPFWNQKVELAMTVLALLSSALPASQNWFGNGCFGWKLEAYALLEIFGLRHFGIWSWHSKCQYWHCWNWPSQNRKLASKIVALGLSKIWTLCLLGNGLSAFWNQIIAFNMAVKMSILALWEIRISALLELDGLGLLEFDDSIQNGGLALVGIGLVRIRNSIS